MRRTVLLAAIAATFLFCSTAQAMPTQQPPGSGAARWWTLAHYVGWPTSQKATLVYIVGRESHGQPHAANPSGCYGLMQLAPCWWAGKPHVKGRPYMFWPVDQLRLALHVWRTCGWGPWSL